MTIRDYLLYPSGQNFISAGTVWEKTFSSKYRVYAVDVDTQGNSYVAGIEQQLNGLYQLCVKKLDPESNILWSQVYSAAIFDPAFFTPLLNPVSIKVSRDSTLFFVFSSAYSVPDYVEELGNLTNLWSGTTVPICSAVTAHSTVDGDLSWGKLIYDDSDPAVPKATRALGMDVDSSNNVYCVTYSTDKKTSIIKFNRAGGYQWSKKLFVSSNVSEIVAAAVRVDVNNALIIAGVTGYTGFLIKITYEGDISTRLTYRFSYQSVPSSLSIGTKGSSIYISGILNSTFSTGNQGFFIKFENEQFDYAKLFTLPSGERFKNYSSSLIITGIDDVFVTFTAESNPDVVLVKFSSIDSLEYYKTIVNCGTTFYSSYAAADSQDKIFIGTLFLTSSKLFKLPTDNFVNFSSSIINDSSVTMSSASPIVISGAAVQVTPISVIIKNVIFLNSAFTVAANVAEIIEGEQIQFTVTYNTSVIPNGTPVQYNLRGISSVDISSGVLTGTFVTNSAGVFQLTVNVIDDNFPDGDKTLTFSVADAATSVVIKDSSDPIIMQLAAVSSTATYFIDKNGYLFGAGTAS